MCLLFKISRENSFKDELSKRLVYIYVKISKTAEILMREIFTKIL